MFSPAATSLLPSADEATSRHSRLLSRGNQFSPESVEVSHRQTVPAKQPHQENAKELAARLAKAKQDKIKPKSDPVSKAAKKDGDSEHEEAFEDQRTEAARQEPGPYLSKKFKRAEAVTSEISRDALVEAIATKVASKIVAKLLAK